MKRLAIILLSTILAITLSTPAVAQMRLHGLQRGHASGAGDPLRMTTTGGGVSGGAPACADTTCTGFLACQNFETATTGYDNSETWSETETGGSTVSPAYTTVHLRGAQSVQIVRGTSTAMTLINTGSEQAEIYAHFLYQTPAIPTTTSKIIAKGLDDASGTVWTIWVLGSDLGTAGQLAVTSGAGVAITTDIISINTTYHVWLHHLNGASGVVSIEFTALTTRAPVGSGSKFATANHAEADGTQYFTLQLSIDGGTEYYDQVLVKTTAIGTVCE